MGFIKICGRFCYWFGRCLNQHDGDCQGYSEPDEDEETDDVIEKLTY